MPHCIAIAKTVGMLVVLDAIFNRITRNRSERRRTAIFIDEIYLLFGNSYSANFLFEMWKRVRKYGAFCTGISQNTEDLLQSHTARTMLANSEFLMMLNQAGTDRQELAKLLNISETQLSYITNADVISKKEAVRKRISEISKEITNLVTLVAKYASEEIAARIPELEKKRGVLEFEYKQLCDSSNMPDITIESIRTKFELARTYLKAGKLQTTRKLIEIFIKEAIVYEDHVEVFFNFHPDLKPPTQEPSITIQVSDSIPSNETEKDSLNPGIDGEENIVGGWGTATPTSLSPVRNVFLQIDYF